MFDIRSITRTGALVALVTVTTGCTSFLSVGSPKYACSGLPEGASCQSTRDIYEATHDGNVPLRLQNDKEDQTQQNRRARVTKDNQTESNNDTGNNVAGVSLRDSVIDNYVAPRLPDRPIPIRTPAEVMRIWVAPWEDTNGDLVTNGYIYTEIEPRRWVIGQQGSADPTVLKPLQTISSKKQTEKSSNE